MTFEEALALGAHVSAQGRTTPWLSSPITKNETDADSDLVAREILSRSQTSRTRLTTI
jgi:hypothetical protein